MLGGPRGRHTVTGTAVARALELRRSRIRLEPLDVLASSVGVMILGTMAASAARASAGIETVAGTAASERLAVLVAGAIVVAATSAAVSSGRRGGPLAVATPLVVLVMLAPVDRGLVLRIPAIRQVIAAGVAGALTGGALWIALAGTVPRASPAWWLSAGGVVGVSCAGVALLGAGVRISGRTSVLVQLVIVGWWSVDALFDTATSPMAVVARSSFSAAVPSSRLVAGRGGRSPVPGVLVTRSPRGRCERSCGGRSAGSDVSSSWPRRAVPSWPAPGTHPRSASWPWR